MQTISTLLIDDRPFLNRAIKKLTAKQKAEVAAYKKAALTTLTILVKSKLEGPIKAL